MVIAGRTSVKPPDETEKPFSLLGLFYIFCVVLYFLSEPVQMIVCMVHTGVWGGVC